MSRIKVPPQNIPFLLQSGLVDPDWYDVLRQLDGLDPLSDVVFPASVSSIDTASGAFTLGYGLSRASQQLLAALSRSSAALGADVALNNTGNYFDGPSVTLGTGTWFVSGTVTVTDSLAGVVSIHAKLWDGTTVISSASVRNQVANFVQTMTLTGFITNPAAAVKISCIDPSATSGKILFNQSGNSKDSHITAVRVA